MKSFKMLFNLINTWIILILLIFEKQNKAALNLRYIDILGKFAIDGSVT